LVFFKFGIKNTLAKIKFKAKITKF
jgi:hypothetical protein